MRQQYNLMGEFLHIRVGNVQILHNNGIQQSYYSITYKERQYFTSTFTHSRPDTDDILIHLQDGRPPDMLTLQRWENCMMVFEFELDTSELKNRRMVRKRLQGRQLQLIGLEMQLYNQKQIFLTQKYCEGISQHYLIVEDLYNTKETNAVRAHNTLNYFTIKNKNTTFFLPVRSSTIVIKLPNSIQISSFVNSHFNGKSAPIDHSRLQNGQQVQIFKDGKCTAKVKLKLKWGVNLHRFRSDQNVLVQANQLLLYDFQLKFDSPNEVAGCKLKVQHGSKAFDFAQDIDHSKLTKIKKIVYFIIKSQNQEIDLLLHKNGKPFANCRVSSTELANNALTIIKKKWQDVNNIGKFYGYIKLRGERGRNVSIPQSNRYWREVAKRKQTATNMMISIQQISVYFPQNQQLALVAKIEGEEKILKQLNNLNFYNDQDQPSKEILDFAVKGQESLYLIVKADLKSNDFCGIGVLNTTDLRLGINACEVGFFKNQEKSGTINCIIHKIVFWPFIKPLFQADVAQQSLPPLQVDLFLNKISLTPYFYTYKYDNKREVYCIVEVNKIKKVLILENVEHDPLSFAAAAGSDTLNYLVQQADVIKIKLTFLVSDLGHEQEIYGAAICKVRAQDLDQKQIKFKNIEIRNDYSVNLGFVTFQAFRGVSPKVLPKLPPEPQKKSINSFDLSSQASFDTHNALPIKNSPSRRYSSGSYINNSKPIIHDFLKKNTHPSKQVKQVKLPIIKERKDKNQFQDLVQMMKVRKRGHGGFYEDNNNGIQAKLDERQMRKQRQSFDLKRIQQSNPNLDRNLQILFPKKGNQKQIQMNRSKQIDYEQRLKGLRSVMNEISDIGQVQPSIAQTRRDRYQQIANETEQRMIQNQRQNEAQWEGNEFV